MSSSIAKDDSVLPAPCAVLPVSSNWTPSDRRRTGSGKTGFCRLCLKGKRCEMGAWIRGHRKKKISLWKRKAGSLIETEVRDYNEAKGRVQRGRMERLGERDRGSKEEARG